jgi:hypothetical protein
MSRFLTPLDIREKDEFEGTFELLAPLVYISDLLDDVITVPAGFITDFASVPRLPFAYLVVGGKGNKAAVVHDWLYSGGLTVTREQADKVFAEALAASGYGALVRGLMYSGVRLGGASHWEGPNQPQPAHVAIQMDQYLA